MGTTISERKAHHLDLCGTDAVAFRQKTTGFESVQFLHNPFPELHIDDIDISTEALGKRLAAPILIASMSGGTDEAIRFNHDLATLAEKYQIAMGLGSMRPLLEEGGGDGGFFLREKAPSILLLGNLGLVQARDLPLSTLENLVERVGADALCLHINPAQERFQPGGDRDFRGGLDTLERVSQGLSVPIIAKETGCGFTQSSAMRARERGVGWIDISGAGGTSWVGVEALRAPKAQAQMGQIFWDWGVPTAASLLQTSAVDVKTIATGGIFHGLDIAKAIALGSTLVGLARPFLLAYKEGGKDGLEAYIQSLIEGLKTAMLLTGAANLEALSRLPLIVDRPLLNYLPAQSPLLNRLENAHLIGRL